MNISKRPFGIREDGVQVWAWTMTSESGCAVEVLDYGATVRSLLVRDKTGKPVDVALGYDTLEEYTGQGGSMGSTVGRFANRIAGGKFTLNGVDYQLFCNNGPNHLHGGQVGFERRQWNVEETREGMKFSRLSPDGEDGYPGNMTVSLEFVWAEPDSLELRYEAVCDRDTPVNLTNHTYFNLEGRGKILDHMLQINADTFLEGDENCLPTGRILPVVGTVMDFRSPRRVGDGVDSEEASVRLSGGYDSNFNLSGGPAAVLTAPRSGITMTVTTDQPGIQIYTANFLDDRKGKDGACYGLRSGICLETQHYPDAIHHPAWPTCILKAGETFRTFTRFAFA